MYVVVTQTGDTNLAALAGRIGAANVPATETALQSYNPQVDWNNLQPGMILFIAPVSGFSLTGVVNMLDPVESGLVPILTNGLSQLNTTIHSNLTNAIAARTTTLGVVSAQSAAITAAGLASEATRLTGVLNTNNTNDTTTLGNFPSPLTSAGIIQTVINDLTTWSMT